MCVFDSYDYSMSDIARNSGLTFKTVLNGIKKLESQGVIKQTRTSGKSIMYQWNKDSVQAKSITKLALDIAIKNAAS